MISRSEQALSNLTNLASWIASGGLVFAAVSKFGGWNNCGNGVGDGRYVCK